MLRYTGRMIIFYYFFFHFGHLDSRSIGCRVSQILGVLYRDVRSGLTVSWDLDFSLWTVCLDGLEGVANAGSFGSTKVTKCFVVPFWGSASEHVRKEKRRNYLNYILK